MLPVNAIGLAFTSLPTTDAALNLAASFFAEGEGYESSSGRLSISPDRDKHLK
jgi:hypothetical protein